MQQKNSFEKQYFCKTFKSFFMRKVNELIEQQELPEKIINLLDVQSNVRNLFYKSVKKQLLQRAIREELLVTLKNLYNNVQQCESKRRIYKHIIFLQFYYFVLQPNLNISKKIYTREIQKLEIIMKKFVDEEGEKSEEYVCLIVRELTSLGKFHQGFKEFVVSMGSKFQFNFQEFYENLKIVGDPSFKSSNISIEKEGSRNAQNPGKNSITSIISQGKSSNGGSICSPKRHHSRTMFMSHPMRFKVVNRSEQQPKPPQNQETAKNKLNEEVSKK